LRRLCESSLCEFCRSRHLSPIRFLYPQGAASRVVLVPCARHGVAEIQVGTGLGAPLLVEGEIPRFLTSWSAKVERMLDPKSAAKLISQVESTLPNLPYHVLVLKDFTYPGDANGISGPFEQSVNGKVTYTSNNPTSSTPYWI